MFRTVESIQVGVCQQQLISFFDIFSAIPVTPYIHLLSAVHLAVSSVHFKCLLHLANCLFTHSVTLPYDDEITHDLLAGLSQVCSFLVLPTRVYLQAHLSVE